MTDAFVTGGSGFVGRALVRRLLAEGNGVRVLVRSERSAATVSGLGAKPVRGELTDASSWQDAVVGCDVLFHLAAETDLAAPRERHERTTVGGTRAALDAARFASVSRFVHCGSEAALLAGEPLLEVDETAPLRPDSRAAYCATKAISEQVVLDANTSGLETVSIRPRFIWGPESTLIEGLVAAVTAGQFAWIEGRHTTNVTHVANAVEGLILGWRRARAGQAYFVTDADRVVLRDFLQTQFEIYGVEAPIPELGAEAAAREIPVPVLWFLGQSCLLRTEKAEAELGYRPVMSTAEGLQTVRDALAISGT